MDAYTWLGYCLCIHPSIDASSLAGGKACEQTTLEGKCAGWQVSLIRLWTSPWLEKPSIPSFSLHSPNCHMFRAISAHDKWVRKEAGTLGITMPVSRKTI